MSVFTHIQSANYLTVSADNKVAFHSSKWSADSRLGRLRGGYLVAIAWKQTADGTRYPVLRVEDVKMAGGHA